MVDPWCFLGAWGFCLVTNNSLDLIPFQRIFSRKSEPEDGRGILYDNLLKRCNEPFQVLQAAQTLAREKVTNVN